MKGKKSKKCGPGAKALAAQAAEIMAGDAARIPEGSQGSPKDAAEAGKAAAAEAGKAAGKAYEMRLQKHMAKALDIAQGRLSRIKHGLSHAVDLQEAIKLAEFYNTDKDIWFKGGNVNLRKLAMEIGKRMVVIKDLLNRLPNERKLSAIEKLIQGLE